MRKSFFYLKVLPMDRNGCMDKALLLLGIREHNRQELRTKLIAKGADAKMADGVLDELEHEGSLSDFRYAQSFIRSSNRRHPEGRSVMLMRLAQKGTDRSASARAVELAYTPEYTAELAARALEAIERNGKAKTGQEKSFLLRKLGFKPSDIGGDDGF